MTDDKQLREMTCKSAGSQKLWCRTSQPQTGQGARTSPRERGRGITVWAGHPESSKTMPGVAELQRLPQRDPSYRSMSRAPTQ